MNQGSQLENTLILVPTQSPHDKKQFSLGVGLPSVPSREPWVTSRQVALTWISPLPGAATPVTAVGVSLSGRQAGRQATPHDQPVSVWVLAGAPEPWFLYHSIECHGKMDGS